MGGPMVKQDFTVANLRSYFYLYLQNLSYDQKRWHFSDHTNFILTCSSRGLHKGRYIVNKLHLLATHSFGIISIQHSHIELQVTLTFQKLNAACATARPYIEVHWFCLSFRLYSNNQLASAQAGIYVTSLYMQCMVMLSNIDCAPGSDQKVCACSCCV